MSRCVTEGSYAANLAGVPVIRVLRDRLGYPNFVSAIDISFSTLSTRKVPTQNQSFVKTPSVQITVHSSELSSERPRDDAAEEHDSRERSSEANACEEHAPEGYSEELPGEHTKPSSMDAAAIRQAGKARLHSTVPRSATWLRRHAKRHHRTLQWTTVL